MASWTFLTNHARVLLLVAHDPGVRLRDIAASLDITERSAFGIITDLVEAGYVIKEKDGRRNRYHIQAHLPLPEPTARERTVGEVLALLAGTDATVTCEPPAPLRRRRRAGGGKDVTDVWVANDEGTEIIRARDIAMASLDYNGNVIVRLAGADGAVVTVVAHRAHQEERRPDDFHRQLIRVIAELSDGQEPS